MREWGRVVFWRFCACFSLRFFSLSCFLIFWCFLSFFCAFLCLFFASFAVLFVRMEGCGNDETAESGLNFTLRSAITPRIPARKCRETPGDINQSTQTGSSKRSPFRFRGFRISNQLNISDFATLREKFENVFFIDARMDLTRKNSSTITFCCVLFFSYTEKKQLKSKRNSPSDHNCKPNGQISLHNVTITPGEYNRLISSDSW